MESSHNSLNQNGNKCHFPILQPTRKLNVCCFLPGLSPQDTQHALAHEMLSVQAESSLRPSSINPFLQWFMIIFSLCHPFCSEQITSPHRRRSNQKRQHERRLRLSIENPDAFNTKMAMGPERDRGPERDPLNTLFWEALESNRS